MMTMENSGRNMPDIITDIAWWLKTGTFKTASLDNLIISDIEAHQFRSVSHRHVYVDPETGNQVVYYLRTDGHILIDDIILNPPPLYVSTNQ